MTGTNEQGPILITGGAGFVGRHLAAHLRAGGQSVRTLDVTGTDDQSALAGPEDTLVGDVRDMPTVQAALQGVSAVIHLAAVVGVQRYVKDPLAVLDVNILGTRHVLKAAHEAGIPVVLASTSEIHGAAVTPLDEDEASVFPNPGRPRWSYAISKLAGEQYARALHGAGLKVAVVRLFNVYGPGLDSPGHGRVVSRFIGQLQDGTPLTLVDKGTEVRAFCYISDAVRGIAMVLRHLLDSPQQTAAPTFAIGRDEPVNMKDLAERMAWFARHEAGFVDVSAEDVFGDGVARIPHRVPKLGKLEAETGFVATVSLNEGLRQTLAAVNLLRREDDPPRAPLSFVRPQAIADTALLLQMGRSIVTGAMTNQGPVARALESQLSARTGAIARVVSNGTAALTAALAVLDVTGIAVLPSFTFAATRNAAVHQGLRICYCDIDPLTWTLDPEALKRLLAVHNDVGVIIPVTAYGVTPDLAAIRKIAGDIPVILDDAHGFGASRDGHEIHPAVAMTTTSFHATKVLPGGEGGAVFCRDEAMARELESLRNHGLQPGEPMATQTGHNLKLSELHAAIALRGIKGFAADQLTRRDHFARLCAATPAAFQLQQIPDSVQHNAQNFAVLAPGDIDQTTQTLVAHGVQPRRYFWPALHQTEAATGDLAGALPHTEAVSARVLCLPLYNRMTDDEHVTIAVAMAACH
ncbi:MAG: DegT/DnrJ/EryC1/StrS family aminotransferase [Myxococcales bacterium]|nr:DegT/DnrJ/EryC1/StrS family aminotransferase [Myxococcales bacterium]